jgi:RNA polymerase sigma-70 factor (ECF subfamily)
VKVLARSAARDAGRKEQRYLALLHRFALGWSGALQQETVPEEQDLRGLVDESLEELNPEDRALIEGKYMQDESVRELASKTGLTDKAVESRLLRLRRQLRERILKNLRSL